MPDINSLIIARAAGQSFDVPDDKLGQLSMVGYISANPLIAILAARSMSQSDGTDSKGDDQGADMAALAEDAQQSAEEAAAAQQAAAKSESGAKGYADAAQKAADAAKAAADAAQAAATAAQNAAGTGGGTGKKPA